MTTLNLNNFGNSQMTANQYEPQNILNYAFPAALVRRLQTEQGWAATYTGRVLTEYRRFLHLAATAPHPVTPSRVVDEAWHLHLTFTRDYWLKLVPLLPSALHHEPVSGEPGDAQETAHYHAQYLQTLETYRQTFGEDAPQDLWPRPQAAPQAASRASAPTPTRRPRRPSGKILLVLAALVLTILAVYLTGNLLLGGVLIAGLGMIGLVMAMQPAPAELPNDPRKQQRDNGSSGGGSCGSSGASCSTGGRSDSGSDNSSDGGGSSCGGGGCGGGGCGN